MKKEKIVEIIILISTFTALIGIGFIYRYYTYVKPNTYNIIFKDIDSIVKGSPVRFMGLNAGYVDRLKRKDKYIICRIRITKKGLKIPDNTQAKIAFNGLGGSKSIELMPPKTDNSKVKGIVAAESLRISDFASVVRDLKDVCNIIKKFVNNFDTELVIKDLNEFTDPEMITRVDKNMEKIIDTYEKQEKNLKLVSEKQKKFSDALDKIENIFKK